MAKREDERMGGVFCCFTVFMLWFTCIPVVVSLYSCCGLPVLLLL